MQLQPAIEMAKQYDTNITIIIFNFYVVICFAAKWIENKNKADKQLIEFNVVVKTKTERERAKKWNMRQVPSS